MKTQSSRWVIFRKEFLAILKPVISGSCSRRKGWLSTQSKERSPGGEGTFSPSASAGQEGFLTPQAEQGCEDQSLEIPRQIGGNRIEH